MDKSIEALKILGARAPHVVRPVGVQAAGRTRAGDLHRSLARAGQRRPADLILVTHPHGDHYDRKAIAGPAAGIDHWSCFLPRAPATGEKGLAIGETVQLSGRAHDGGGCLQREQALPPEVGQLAGLPAWRSTASRSTTRGYRCHSRDERASSRHRPGSRSEGCSQWTGGRAREAVDLLQATLSIPMHYGMLLGGSGAGLRFCRRVGPGSLVLPEGMSAGKRANRLRGCI